VNALVHAFTDEVQWFQTVTRKETNNQIQYHLGHFFVPTQKTHSTTTEMVGSTWLEIFEEAKALCGGDVKAAGDIIKQTTCWSHSHHTMGTSPSGQDHKNFEEFAADRLEGEEPLIMMIWNQKDSVYTEIIDPITGLWHTNVPMAFDTSSVDLSFLPEAKAKVSKLTFNPTRIGANGVIIPTYGRNSNPAVTHTPKLPINSEDRTYAGLSQLLNKQGTVKMAADKIINRYKNETKAPGRFQMLNACIQAIFHRFEPSDIFQCWNENDDTNAEQVLFDLLCLEYFEDEEELPLAVKTAKTLCENTNDQNAAWVVISEYLKELEKMKSLEAFNKGQIDFDDTSFYTAGSDWEGQNA